MQTEYYQYSCGKKKKKKKTFFCGFLEKKNEKIYKKNKKIKKKITKKC